MSDNDECMEVMDITSKDHSSSDSEAAKSDVVELENDQVSVKSCASPSSSSILSVGDEKVSNPDKIVVPVPESDSSTSVKDIEQEADATRELPEIQPDEHSLAKEIDKFTSKGEMSKRAREKCSKSPRKQDRPVKRQRLLSNSESETGSKSRDTNAASKYSASKTNNGTFQEISKKDGISTVSHTHYLELQAKERFSLISINNPFFSTPQTRIIHKEYRKLFDFKKFRQARSLDISSYGHILSMREIPLFLSRFLLEDILDFVDFLNGTKAELYLSGQNSLPEPFSVARQLAFVRSNFQKGIQQLECRTVNHIIEQLEYYIVDDARRLQPSDLEQDVIDLVSEGESSDSNSRIESCSEDSPAPEIVRRLLTLDPEIEQLSLDDKLNYLGSQRREIVKSVFIFMCKTRLVLDVCLEPEYRDNRTDDFEQCLKKYLTCIKATLKKLVELREECCTSLPKSEPGSDDLYIICILNIKISVANYFKDLLRTLHSNTAAILEMDIS